MVRVEQAMTQSALHHRVFGRVHIVLNGPIPPEDDPSAPYAYFGIDHELTYDPFLDDFGPTNLLYEIGIR